MATKAKAATPIHTIQLGDVLDSSHVTGLADLGPSPWLLALRFCVMGPRVRSTHHVYVRHDVFSKVPEVLDRALRSPHDLTGDYLNRFMAHPDGNGGALNGCTKIWCARTPQLEVLSYHVKVAAQNTFGLSQNERAALASQLDIGAPCPWMDEVYKGFKVTAQIATCVNGRPALSVLCFMMRDTWRGLERATARFTLDEAMRMLEAPNPDLVRKRIKGPARDI